MLTAMKMDIAWIGRRAASEEGITRELLTKRVHDLSETTDGLIREVRRISSELRPGLLDDLGLGSAIAWEAEELERRTGIACTLRNDLDERVAFGRDFATAVFRAFQEALTNIVRHAQAHKVEIDLAEEDGYVVLDVRDDGRGISPHDIDDPRSLGLVGIRERARRLGGAATFARGDTGGTIVTLRLPREPPPSSSFR
jgi:signal transduction histidine kinase